MIAKEYWKYLNLEYMYRICVFIGIIIVFVSCKSTQVIHFDNSLFWSDNLPIREVFKIENQFNSKDISEASKTVGFGINIYPNVSHFDLQKPKVFLRSEEGELPYTVFYQHSSDSITRLVVYEWNLEDRYDTISKEAKNSLNKSCLEKFDALTKLVTSKLGLPLEQSESTSGRKEIRWHSTNGTHAFLISFGPRIIRLSIYSK
jgi:hypothetical protein